ncbi:hypothetical protein [Foetidibacter luteolus]|uniref:hypothetical protein n=1 Tax=Foetidibacter luteolus TaxID=2608880 RepID=UPI00129ABCD8|nr:hypothetical protein [Foetidibacter luteolus]
MSIGSFFAGIWKAVKKLFNKLDDESKKLLPVIIDVVNNAKNYNEGIAGDVLSKIIPGDLDDNIREKLKEWLPKLIKTLAATNECANAGDDNAIMQCALAKIGGSEKDVRKVFYHGLAALLLEKLGDGKFTWDDAVATVQWFYKHKDEADDDDDDK